MSQIPVGLSELDAPAIDVTSEKLIATASVTAMDILNLLSLFVPSANRCSEDWDLCVVHEVKLRRTQLVGPALPTVTKPSQLHANGFTDGRTDLFDLSVLKSQS